MNWDLTKTQKQINLTIQEYQLGTHNLSGLVLTISGVTSIADLYASFHSSLFVCVCI